MHLLAGERPSTNYLNLKAKPGNIIVVSQMGYGGNAGTGKRKAADQADHFSTTSWNQIQSKIINVAFHRLF
jgi:hypothetical protein